MLQWVLQNYAQRLIESWTGLQYDSLRRMANPVHRAELTFKLAVRIDQGLASIGEPPVFGPLYADMFSAAKTTVSAPGDLPVERPLMLAALELQAAIGRLGTAALKAAEGLESLESVEQQAEMVARAARAVAAVFRVNPIPMAKRVS